NLIADLLQLAFLSAKSRNGKINRKDFMAKSLGEKAAFSEAGAIARRKDGLNSNVGRTADLQTLRNSLAGEHRLGAHVALARTGRRFREAPETSPKIAGPPRDEET